MRGFWRRVTALLVFCALGLNAALADELGLEHALGAYFEVENDLHFEASVQLETLLPYGAGTLEKLNEALRYMSVSASVGNEETQVAFRVAGDTVIDLAERSTDGGTELTTALLPNRTLQSAGEAMDVLSGRPTGEAAFDFFRAIEEAQNGYRTLTEAITPYATAKKASYNIKGVGSAKWSVIARLTAEQGAELAPLVAEVLGCGMDEGYREQLRGMTCAKGFVIGLYQTREGGEDLAVYMKGNVIFPDGASRSLSYQWAFATDKSGVRTDTYKYMMRRSKAPKDDREISATYKRGVRKGELVAKGECTQKVIDPQTHLTTRVTLRHDLSGTEKKGVRTAEGKVEQVTSTSGKDGSSTVTLTLEPRLSLAVSEGSGVLGGTVAFRRKTGKNTDLAFEIGFDDAAADAFVSAAESGALYVVVDPPMPPSSLTQNREEAEEKPEAYLVGQPPVGYESHTAPKEEAVVNLDTMEEQELAGLMDELAQNLAGRLLVALSKLPDHALLSDNMSEADYAAFLALVEGL